MEIQKKDRATLKSYFVKNAVPTEGNFFELIDGIVNQKDDGIVKVQGEPLSLQAEGSDRKAINFYKSFADPKAAWSLSLNPRVDPANPASATKLGWSIGDAGGASKLFIDQGTGNVGIGTVEPGGYKLNVNGPALFTGNYLSVNSENAGRLRVGAAWGMPGLYSSDDGEKPLVLGVPAGQKVYLGMGTGDAFVEGGTGNSYFKGKIGIGTAAPSHKFHVVAEDAVGLFESSGTMAYLRLSTKEGIDNRVELANRPGGRLALWTAGGSDVLNITKAGNVGIGTEAPVNKLEVTGNAVFRGTFKARSMRVTRYAANVTKAVALSKVNTWGDFPELTVTFTLAQEADVIAFFGITMPSSDTHLCTKMVVDNVERPETRSITGNTTYCSPSSCWMGTLAAGSHTIKVQYRTPAASVLNPGDDWQKGALMVTVYGAE